MDAIIDWFLVDGRLGLILVLSTIAVCLFGFAVSRCKFKRSFAARDPARPREVLSGYSEKDIEFLSPVLVRLEEVLGVPPGRLRVTDRFEAELRSDPKVTLQDESIEIQNDLKAILEEEMDIATVDDFLRGCLVLEGRFRDPARLNKTLFG